MEGEGTVAFSTPVTADLGLSPDGTDSIIFGTTQGELWVIRKDGSGNWGPAAGFPVVVGTYVASSPAVGDLDKDGVLDIVVGHGDPASLGPGGMKAYKRDGTLLWSRDSQDGVEGADGKPDPVVGSPAIGDLDRDGDNEVVWGSLDFRLYVVNGADGTDLPGWPLQLNDVIRSSPALHDLSGDGRLEIAIGHASNVNPPDPPGGCLRVFKLNGSLLPGFPRCIDQTINGGPSIGDIDGDGEPEIVHGTGTFYASTLERVYAWNCDGSAVEGWPVAIQGLSPSSPALANLDGEPALEVIVTSEDPQPGGLPTDYYVYGYNGDGNRIFETVPKHFFGDPRSVADPVVGDVLGNDATPEVVVPASSSVVVIAADGTLLTDDGTHPMGVYAFYADGAVSGVAVADLEDDGQKIEVIAIAAPVVAGMATDDLTIHVWNPISRSTPPPWGFFRQNPARLGVAPMTPACPGPCEPEGLGLDFFTVEPCRLIDTRADDGPALQAGETRGLMVTGICGVPNTARALALNVTVTQPTGTGFLRFSPGGCTPSITSTINFNAGDTRANNAVLPVASDGSGILKVDAAVQNGGQVQLILDVTGYFE